MLKEFQVFQWFHFFFRSLGVTHGQQVVSDDKLILNKKKNQIDLCRLYFIVELLIVNGFHEIEKMPNFHECDIFTCHEWLLTLLNDHPTHRIYHSSTVEKCHPIVILWRIPF